MSKNNISFILHKPQLSENIGACARAIKNFSFKKLVLINPKPIYPNDKILATSVGAKNIIKQSKKYDNLEKALSKIDIVIATSSRFRNKNIKHINLEDLKRRMEGAISAFSHDLAGLRTGRASVTMIDQITVDAYGSKMPIEQVGTISVPEPRTISIQVWDKGLVVSVEKSIQESGLGLNPQTDGQLVRIPVPELNEERRQELIKIAGKYAEQSRVSIRNIRRDGMDSIKSMEKNSEIGKDESVSLSSTVQDLTDDHIKKIDQTLLNKEQEIKQV